MKNLLVLFMAVFASSVLVGQASLEGTVVEKSSGETIIGGTVSIFKGETLVTGTDTDFNGFYSINGLNPGTYDIEVSYVGYTTQKQTGVTLFEGKTVEVNFEISEGVLLEEAEIIAYKAPLFEKDQTSSSRTVTSENIMQLATRNVNTIAATAGGIASIDGEELNIGGARANATNYYVDGIRVSGNLIPDSEIEQLQTLVGGLDAKYGDATGGVISVTTKGPADRFSGSFDAETSNFLDDFERTLIRGALSGPIFKNKETDKTVIGYRVSGQYTHQEYPYAYLGNYIYPTETIAQLENQPLSNLGGSLLPTAEGFGNAFLTRQTPNEQDTRLTGTARIDWRISDEIDLSVTGAYQNRDFNFIPGANTTTFGTNAGTWRRLNHQNNPFGNDESLRANMRWRHRIGAGSTGEEGASSLIRNVSYTIQFAFERESRLREDQRHRDRLFDYGHVGQTQTQAAPVFGFIEDSLNVGVLALEQTGYNNDIFGYTPSTINPIFDRYNSGADPSDPESAGNLVASNGLITNQGVWSNFFANVGNVYDRYFQTEDDRYTVNASSSFDLFPGGSDKGRHNIEVGFMYEQRIERFYRVSPNRLWLVGNQLQNDIFDGLDRNNVIGQQVATVLGFTDTVDIFGNNVRGELNSDLAFYRNIREKFGVALDEQIYINDLDPDQLDLEMFSAFELLQNGLMFAQGYDRLGNRTGSDASFEGFFKDTLANGARSFLSPAFEPIYTGVYLQDRFSYKDLLFKVGVRMDRYDANAPVLRDPFSLYEIQTAGEFFGDEIAQNIDPNWKVYTTTDDGEVVQGYRDGEQWYAADGTPVNDGIQLFGQQAPNPKLRNPDDNIQDVNYDLDRSFRDYEPVMNWMPRIAFSFPISDEANFFAHYDVTYQRPLARSFVAPQTYFLLPQLDFGSTSPLSNTNLQQERTTDFEVGFQQKISNNSALRVAATYREFRDQIQARLFNFTDNIGNSNRYFGFDNIDVSTVQMLNFRYDLRRVKNFEMYLSYVLSFAEGTGSSETSSLALIGNGQQVTEINPLNFDERHQFNLSLDFRYGSGKKYNGPKIGGKDIFSNAGINMLVNAVSGRPFTRAQEPQPFGEAGFAGGINESRYPFRFNVDLQVNKAFVLNPNLDRSAGDRPVTLNVFFRALNLLDTQNIIGWYRASLSDTDDGWLRTDQGQSVFGGIQDSPVQNEEIWLQARQWGLVNNDFYTLPRRMFLGASVSF